MTCLPFNDVVVAVGVVDCKASPFDSDWVSFLLSSSLEANWVDKVGFITDVVCVSDWAGELPLLLLLLVVAVVAVVVLVSVLLFVSSLS